MTPKILRPRKRLPPPTDGGSPRDTKNSLTAITRAKLLEMIGEGELEELPVGGAKGIYFGETALQNSDDTLNFKGVVWEARSGLPDQPILQGFEQTETSVGNSLPAEAKLTTPVVRTITGANIDRLRVIVSIPALFLINTHPGAPDDGKELATSVSYQIHIRPTGGTYALVEQVDIVDQKTHSPYTRAHKVVLPPSGSNSWDLKVTRLTADSTDPSKVANQTFVDSIFAITDGKFIYPNCGLVGINVDSKQFGSAIGARAFKVRGLKTMVPTNYDPVTRTYTGIWDGTFKRAWHANPAWVFYDLLTNSRYGLGEFITLANVDKWGLYAISQYCDELIPSGFKDGSGGDILRPRFTFNGTIRDRQEAYKVLQSITIAFRGMAYWSLGQVFASNDMPQDPVTILSPANVIGGAFKYSGTALKARHSVAAISWRDPQDFYKPAIELIPNDDMIYRLGWRQVDIDLPYCTSRGEAHCFGKWVLDVEQHETETVNFAMSWDSYVLGGGQTVKPGDLILISDPRKSGGVRASGRLATSGLSQFTLDAAYDPTPGMDNFIRVLLPSGELERRQISSFSNSNKTVHLASPLSAAPGVGAMWMIDSTDLKPRSYRVLTVEEAEKNIFRISALFHDPLKYARVERDIIFEDLPYTRFREELKPPINVQAVENKYLHDGLARSRLVLSWTPNDFFATGYKIEAETPRGFATLSRDRHAAYRDFGSRHRRLDVLCLFGQPGR
jgi:predicted phage tail protein